ncbi:MAG: ATP-dependent Clp protease adaptor ClpS [Phycisphaerae bacterium]
MAETEPNDTTVAPTEGGVATVTKHPPAKKPSKREPRQLPPYKVLLHNDDANTFEHVILSVVKLTPLSPDEAIQRTLEADASDVALLLVTHRERAELYQEQFASLSITVTIEPDV